MFFTKLDHWQWPIIWQNPRWRSQLYLKVWQTLRHIGRCIDNLVTWSLVSHIAKVSQTSMAQSCGFKKKITIIKARWIAAFVYVNFTVEPGVTRQTVTCVSIDLICAISCWETDKLYIGLHFLILAKSFSQLILNWSNFNSICTDL